MYFLFFWSILGILPKDQMINWKNWTEMLYLHFMNEKDDMGRIIEKGLYSSLFARSEPNVFFVWWAWSEGMMQLCDFSCWKQPHRERYWLSSASYLETQDTFLGKVASRVRCLLLHWHLTASEWSQWMYLQLVLLPLSGQNKQIQNILVISKHFAQLLSLLF